MGRRRRINYVSWMEVGEKTEGKEALDDDDDGGEEIIGMGVALTPYP